MKSLNRITLLTISLIAMMTLSMVFYGVNAAIPKIGTTLQSRPYESNPQADANNVGLTPPLTTIRDGDLGTSVQWSIGASTLAYSGVNATSFKNTPPATFTIGWVDIKIKYKAEATTNDQYRIICMVTGSATVRTLQGWVSGASAKFDYNGAADERVWSRVMEPTNNVWDWTDISNLKVCVQTQQMSGSDDGNIFTLFEVWVTIYEGAYPYATLSAIGALDKWYDADIDGVWDANIEPGIRDVDGSGTYTAGDVVLINTAPALGMALKVPPATTKFWDLNGNKIWDEQESGVRDANNDGFYGGPPDAVLGGPTPSRVSIQPSVVQGLKKGDKFFVDVFVTMVAGMHGFQFLINYNPYVVTATDYFAYNLFILQAPTELSDATYLKTNGFDDTKTGWSRKGISPYLDKTDYYTDIVLAGTAPPDGSYLGSPGSDDTYYDENGNSKWDVGEPAVKDVDFDLFYWPIAQGGYDYVLVGPDPPDFVTLSSPGTYDKYADLDYSGIWDVGEPAIRDINNNFEYDLLPPRAWGNYLSAYTILWTPGVADTYYDADSSGTWDVGEPAIRDVDGSFTYNAGDLVLAGTAPPDGSPLTIPGALDKFWDRNCNKAWDVGETAIRDTNNNGVYDAGDVVLAGATPADGSIGDFAFEDLPGDNPPENYGGTVYVELNATQDGDDQLEIWLHDGTTWTLADTVTPPNAWGLGGGGGSGAWTASVDVGRTGSQILDTKAKINNAKVYLVRKVVGTPDRIAVDAMRLNVGLGYAAVAFSSYMGDPTGYTGSQPVIRVYFQVKVDALSPLHFSKSLLTYTTGMRITHVMSDGEYRGPQWLSAVTPGTLNPIKIPVGPAPSNPIGTSWHEIFPYYSHVWRLNSWTDNGDGYLSASDQIDMLNETDWTYWFHVDVVTTTIHWTFKTGPPPGEPIPEKMGRAEPSTPFTEMPPGSPVGSKWHQIYPPGSFCRNFTITSWTDNGNPGFDASDQFDFKYDAEPGVTYWAHLDAVSTDIIITPKGAPEPPIPEFPLGIGIIMAIAPLIPVVYLWRTRPKRRVTKQ